MDPTLKADGLVEVSSKQKCKTVCHALNINTERCIIQDGSGEKLNILGKDSIGHCERREGGKVLMFMCLIRNVYQNRAL